MVPVVCRATIGALGNAEHGIDTADDARAAMTAAEESASPAAKHFLVELGDRMTGGPGGPVHQPSRSEFVDRVLPDEVITELTRTLLEDRRAGGLRIAGLPQLAAVVGARRTGVTDRLVSGELVGDDRGRAAPVGRIPGRLDDRHIDPEPLDLAA